MTGSIDDLLNLVEQLANQGEVTLAFQATVYISAKVDGSKIELTTPLVYIHEGSDVVADTCPEKLNEDTADRGIAAIQERTWPQPELRA